jgi:hypothetical protein
MSYLMQCTLLLLCSKPQKFVSCYTRNHGRYQSEATLEGALSIHCVPYPIRVNIFLPYHINTGSISQTMSNCALQVSQHMLHNNLVCLCQLTYKLAKCTHCIANIWSGVNHIHQLSNQLFVQSQINFVIIGIRHT